MINDSISHRIQSALQRRPRARTAERRHWGTYNFAALWVSMSVNILTYMLAASLIQGGMNWKQAVVTVFLGNTIVLIPMLLNSHPGARYGIPFPGSGARFVRRAGRKFRRGSARARRLRMVRHSNLDRRRSDQHADRDARSRLGTVSAQHCNLLSRILADQSRGHSQGNRVHPFSAGNQRAGSAWPWDCCCWRGPTTRPADSAPCCQRRRGSSTSRTS